MINVRKMKGCFKNANLFLSGPFLCVRRAESEAESEALTT